VLRERRYNLDVRRGAGGPASLPAGEGFPAGRPTLGPGPDRAVGFQRRLGVPAARDVAERGKFYSPWGIDYFVFPHHLYTDVPNFTIGRPAWDNWMVYQARTTFGMAIDASRDVLVVHQNHDYSHLPGNKPPYGSEVAKSNLAKAGGQKHVYNILDTNRELAGGRICKPQFRLVRLLRRMERMFINDERKGWGWEISLRLQQMQRPLSTKPRRQANARRT